MIGDEDVPLWLGVELIASVVALEDGALQQLANASGGHFTAASLAERLRILGATPGSRPGGAIRYQVVEQTPEQVLAVAAAEAEPQDLGMLMRFTLDRDVDLWDSEVLELDRADALFRRNSAPVQTITPSERGT